jgi:hypothetical protein
MDLKRMNWFGLVGSIVTFILVVLSVTLASPWWQLTAGQELLQVDYSPLSYSIRFMGSQVSAPIVWFINLAAQLSLLASAIAMLIYSILPNKSYSKSLLNFAYKKPILIVVIFAVSLFAITYIAGMLLSINVPLVGSADITLDFGAAAIELSIMAGFTWVFWLAVVSAGLCFVARLYHRKVSLT